MTILLTGATGFLGSYVADDLLHEQNAPLAVLVRAPDERGAIDKLWRAWQLHMGSERFWDAIARTRIVLGDLTAPGLGLGDGDRRLLRDSVTSILHVAASLNRRSEKACLNVNVRGTLAALRLARTLADAGQLRRFDFVSTVAVAGERQSEVVTEDEAIDWSRRDYDPYARTKKLCEHLIDELLPDVPHTIFRPSMVIGDSRFPDTSQFDMIRAVCILADLPAVPIRPDARQDIVPADYVGRAIATLHTREGHGNGIYHLSAGTQSSRTTRALSEAIFAHNPGRPPLHLPALEGPFAAATGALARRRRRDAVTATAAMMDVFLPYITFDTVFDNDRVVQALGAAPPPFTEYGPATYRWAKDVGFQYPYRPLPERPARVAVPGPEASA
ncbi:MAG: SDR family oxidoreductase [Myxococcota bacterium]